MTHTMRSHFAEDDFRKATASQPDRDCVRVARLADRVEVRDDKTAFGGPDDHRIVLTATEFDRFQEGIRAGETTDSPLHVSRRPDDTYLLRSGPVTLTFTAPEMAAFLDGVHQHEFDLAEYATPVR
ncbi:MAG: DUF397 domain-containing protein [Pseudonocardia sp.]